jgi:multiple sugar transport system ATP-binding protein
VLLLDEPLAHLDAALRDQLRCELRRLNEALAITMIYVTHDWQEAMSLGERIAVLDAGRLQQIGPPLQVYDRPQTLAVAGMLGSPPMNFIAGRLVGDERGVRIVGGGWETAPAESQSARLADYAGREVVWGVRPEHIRVTAAGDSSAAAFNLAKISVVETLGDSTILRLRPGKTACGFAEVDLTVRQPGRCQWHKDDQLIVHMEAENCHVFDSDSKQNLLL